MPVIQWGIVGTGAIAKRFAAALSQVEGADLAGVASRSADRAAEFAAEYGAKRVFASYEEMAGCREIDAAYIATPHSSHCENTVLFLNAGKHVLCEKPMAVNAKEVRRMIAAAKEKDCFLMEAMWTRFLPAVIQALSLIKEGEIGKIERVKADFCFSSVYNPVHRLYNPALGGGALLDVGIYAMSFACFVLGTTPENIAANAIFAENGVDASTTVQLHYPHGIIADLTASIAEKKPCDAVITGSGGKIILPNFYTADHFYLENEGGKKTYTVPYRGNGFEEEIEAVINCMADGKTEEERMPLSFSLSVAELMDRVREQIGLRYPSDDK